MNPQASESGALYADVLELFQQLVESKRHRPKVEFEMVLPSCRGLGCFRSSGDPITERPTNPSRLVIPIQSHDPAEVEESASTEVEGQATSERRGGRSKGDITGQNATVEANPSASVKYTPPFFNHISCFGYRPGIVERDLDQRELMRLSALCRGGEPSSSRPSRTAGRWA